MRKIQNLLIVAGDGRKAGKTSICRRIIKESGVKGLTAIKISPHFHEPGEGLQIICKKDGFAVYEETNRNSHKDSSLMLQSGAEKVYYIQAKDEMTAIAFGIVLEYIAEGGPIICESPSLIEHFKPGVFIIMLSDDSTGRKDISWMREHAHLEYRLTEINEMIGIPVRWTGSEWIQE